MNLNRTEKDRIFTWEYDKLRVFGAFGQFSAPLSELHSLTSHLGIDFAPVKTEQMRDFLAGFCFNPIVDVTAVQYLDLLTDSIVCYTLDNMEGRRLFDSLLTSSRFALKEPNPRAVSSLHEEIGLLNVRTYEMSRGIASILRTDVEKVFGVVHYANFLQQYRGMDSDQSQVVALQRFGLSLPS